MAKTLAHPSDDPGALPKTIDAMIAFLSQLGVRVRLSDPFMLKRMGPTLPVKHSVRIDRDGKEIRRGKEAAMH